MFCSSVKELDVVMNNLELFVQVPVVSLLRRRANLCRDCFYGCLANLCDERPDVLVERCDKLFISFLVPLFQTSHHLLVTQNINCRSSRNSSFFSRSFFTSLSALALSSTTFSFYRFFFLFLFLISISSASSLSF